MKYCDLQAGDLFVITPNVKPNKTFLILKRELVLDGRFVTITWLFVEYDEIRTPQYSVQTRISPDPTISHPWQVIRAGRVIESMHHEIR